MKYIKILVKIVRVYLSFLSILYKKKIEHFLVFQNSENMYYFSYLNGK